MICDNPKSEGALIEENKVLNRAKKVIDNYDNKNLNIYEEYKYLFNKYKNLIEQIQYIFKISDTYQNDLINTKEELEKKINEKKETEKELNKKIKELETTKMKLEKANKKLKKISSRDQLTGLYNRREFEKIIQREWRNAIRENNPISIIMMDIDYFKKFNDNYGHLAGDNCLQKISKRMKQTLKRPRDFIARYGGEEFVAILPDTDKKGAKYVAELLREAVENLEINHNTSSVSDYVTISLGVSFTAQPGLYVFEELLDLADNALYKAKGEGRNRYCIKEL